MWAVSGTLQGGLPSRASPTNEPAAHSMLSPSLDFDYVKTNNSGDTHAVNYLHSHINCILAGRILLNQSVQDEYP
jgi:hypothetical protein